MEEGKNIYATLAYEYADDLYKGIFTGSFDEWLKANTYENNYDSNDLDAMIYKEVKKNVNSSLGIKDELKRIDYNMDNQNYIRYAILILSIFNLIISIMIYLK